MVRGSISSNIPGLPFNVRRGAGIAACVLALAIPVAATAQQPAESSAALEEIIVTAQRREENLQQTAIAVTAVSGETLAAVNAQSLYDISRVAPNIEFGGSQGGSNLYIRGIGQQQSGLLSDPGAVIYIDGVYRPRVASNSTNFSDVQRVEVLRGPQGTLFGKNAIGGALNITSIAPSNDLGAAVDLQAGSRDRIKAGGWVNLPVVQDRLVARLSVESNKQDGYMKNLQTGEKLSDTDFYTARAGLLWNPSNDFQITVRGDYTKEDQIGVGARPIENSNASYLALGEYETRGTAPSYSRLKDYGVSATLEWKVGPGTFKSITAKRTWTQDFSQDTDGTPDPVYTAHVSSNAKDDFISEELQYTAAAFDDRLSLTAGAFYMDEDIFSGVYPRIAAPPVQINLDNYRDQTTKSYALFGQGTYAFTDSVDLTLGLRYSRDKKDIDFFQYNYAPSPTNPTFPLGGVDLDTQREASYSALTPKATLQYQIIPDVMTYITAARGFKAGGFNNQPTAPEEFTAFAPEYVWNYEAGLKSEWLDRRLRANIAVYRMNYTDIQLTFTGPSGISTVANVGEARINGLETEFNFLATPSLLLNVSYGYNDFKITHVAPGTEDVTTQTVLPNFPKVNASGGLQYTVDIGTKGSIVLRTDYSWKDKIYYDSNNTESFAQDAYGLWSARLTYRGSAERWSVYAYGTNLADTYYHLYGQSSLGMTATMPGPPRELGLGLMAKF